MTLQKLNLWLLRRIQVRTWELHFVILLVSLEIGQKNEEIQVVYKLYRNNGRLCDKNVEPPSNLKRKHNSNSILKCSIFGFHMIS